MAYSKKPLFLFSTVALSTTAVAGFFIRQKILNNWKISEFNALLKQIEDLETEIKKNEKDLKDNEKLKNSIEEQIQNIKKNIEKFKESINKNNKKLSELESKNASWKRKINFAKFLEIYEKLKLNAKNDSEKVKSTTSYYKTILHYIDNQKNMLDKIGKYIEVKQKEEKQKENLENEEIDNKKLLSELKDSINTLTENIKSKKLSLAILKDQEREREVS